MNACSAHCGWCGRCTTDEGQPETKPVHVCDRPGCDRTLNMFAVSIAGLGAFCSRTCADKEQAAFEEHMKRRGHMLAKGA